MAGETMQMAAPVAKTRGAGRDLGRLHGHVIARRIGHMERQLAQLRKTQAEIAEKLGQPQPNGPRPLLEAQKAGIERAIAAVSATKARYAGLPQYRAYAAASRKQEWERAGFPNGYGFG